MYFYKLSASGYEDHYETIFYNEKKYTQEEFENIIFKLYEESCQEKLQNTPDSKCYPEINFNSNDIIWDYKNAFNKKMAEYGFHELNKKLTGYMFFDLTVDETGYNQENGFFETIYQDVDTSYRNRIKKIRNNLKFDTSCWDNNCPLLEDESDEDKEYARSECLVHQLKSQKIKRTCENCISYNDCSKKEFGNCWIWNGKE